MTEEGRGLKFNIPHHFESNVKASGAFNNPARTRRLAQEAVTLSTSLPLSYNSSVFVRCDEERLDIMKVQYVLSSFFQNMTGLVLLHKHY